MEATANTWLNSIFNVYTLIALIVIIVVGIFLGFKQKITVFRDYNDLGLVFLLGLSSFIFFYIFSLLPEDQKNVGIAFILIVELLLFLWIVVRTYQDNQNIFYTLLALITKIPLSILFIFNFLSFVAPNGKTMGKRADVRYSSFAFLLLLTPIILGLVKNKEGLLNLDRTLSHRGIGV